MPNLKRSAVFGLCLLVTSAQAQSDFFAWLSDFRVEAQAKGISTATLDSTLGNARPAPQVLALDTSQPEFVSTFLTYLNRHVSAQKIARGRALLIEHQALLADVEQRYGIPPRILVAFWGMETNYGSYTGDTPIPAALATLAYDGRRSAFFRAQLLDALSIIEEGHVRAADMKGSWAGAMGLMQFMPSTYRRYAVDGDGDGRINLWTLADAMHSAGNYLNKAGWKRDQPGVLQVRLPTDFMWGDARLFNRRSMQDWKTANVVQASGTPLPDQAWAAAIVLPQGWRGPAFMVFDNFDVIMQWNRSVSYALSVAILADQLVGSTALPATGESAPPLSHTQLAHLQQKLTELGFDTGAADGLAGIKTQSAIRRFQVAHQLPADGYPSAPLLSHVQNAHADAMERGKLKSPLIAPVFSDPIP